MWLYLVHNSFMLHHIHSVLWMKLWYIQSRACNKVGIGNSVFFCEYWQASVTDKKHVLYQSSNLAVQI